MPSDPNRSSGDQAAAQQQFLSLCLRGEREVFRYVAALVPNVADAEDIVQQTGLALWKKFEAYDPARPFTPWACRFALNKARQWIERRQRWQALLAGGLAEELATRREELRPEFERRLTHLEGCLANCRPTSGGWLKATTIGARISRDWPTRPTGPWRPRTRCCSAFVTFYRSASKTPRVRRRPSGLPGGASPMWPPLAAPCRTQPSWAARERKAAGQGNKPWSFAA